MFVQEKRVRLTFITFMDFRATLMGALTLSHLRSGVNMYKVSVDSKDLRYVLKQINEKSSAGRLDPNNLRLYVPSEIGTQEYVVDQKGRVRKQNGEEYTMSPLSFLFLNDYLDHLKVKNGIKEGSPLYR